MKIAFVGNQDNNAYRICKWVRQRGLQADLYMIRQERGPRSQPSLVDPELTADGGNFPDWLRLYDDRGMMWFLRPSRLARQIERDYDLVVTSGATGLLAVNHFRAAPLIHLTLGSEVSDHAMRLFSLRASLPWRGVSLLMRRALRKTHRIVTVGFWPEMRALARLGHLDKTVVWAFPEDTLSNRQRVDQELLKKLNASYASCERVFLWLSRLNFRDPSAISYKAPEVFLEAFERLALGDGRKVRAIVGSHGDDLEAFQRMVVDKGLADRIEYVPHLPLWKMLTYASVANVIVVDVPNLERGHVPGGLTREALSVGAVIVQAWDEQIMEFIYGKDCPILQARDVPSCYQSMKRVVEMSPAEFEALKTRCYDWARQNLHYDKPLDRLLRLMGEVAYAQRFRKGDRTPA